MSPRLRRERNVGRLARLASTRAAAALVAALLLFLQVDAQTQRPRPRSNPRGAAADVQRVARELIRLLAEEDLSGVSALWSKSSPNAAPFVDFQRQYLSEYKRSFDPPVIWRVREKSGRASLRLKADFVYTDSKTGWTRRNGFLGEVSLVREAGGWKIWQVENYGERLAAALAGQTEAERARTLSEEKDSITAGLADELINLGGAYTGKGDFKQSLNVYELALSVSKRAGAKWSVRDALWGVAHVSYQLGDYDRAVANYQQAVALSEELGDTRTTAPLLSNLGDSFAGRGEYASALDHYRRSLALYERVGEASKFWVMLKRVGNAYYNQHDYARALESYRKSLDATEDFGAHRDVLEDMTDAFEGMKDYKNSLACRWQSLAASEVDAKALGELTDKFFPTAESWNMKGWFSLWSSDSPAKGVINPPESDDQLGGISFPGSSKNNALTAYNVTRRQFLTRDKWALARVSLEKKQGVARDEWPDPLPEKAERVIEFIREDGGWKVWRYYPATLFLAANVASSDIEGEREAMLAEEPGLVNLELTHQLVAAANELVGRRHYARAREAYELARRLAERFGDRSGVAVKLTRIAYTYDAQGDSDNALEFCRRALALRTELGERHAAADSLSNIAYIHFEQGDFDAALEYLRKSDAMLSGLNDDESKGDFAFTSLMTGQIDLLRGELTQARERFENSLKIFTELEDEDGISTALQAVGQMHMLQGDYKQAMQSLQTSRDVSQDPDDYTLNRLIGITYFAQGSPNLAVNFLLRSESQPGEGAEEQQDFLREGYNDFVKEDYARSMKQFEQAAPQQEELGNRIDTAAALYFIGLLRSIREDDAGAAESLEKSLRLSEQARRKPFAAETLMYLAFVYEDAKRYDKALESYERSLRLYREMGNKLLVCRLTLELAGFMQRRGDARALKLAEESNALARQLNAQQFLWLSETLLGRAYAASKEQAKAEQFFGLAIRSVEALRTNVSGGGLEKERFFEDKLSPYDGMVELLAGAGRPLAALGFAEQRKARVLLEVLQGNRLGATKALPPKERAEESKLIARLGELNRGVRQAEAARPCDRDALAALVEQRRRARVDFNTFQARLAARFPEEGGAAAGGPHEPSLEEVAALVPDEQTALLEYVVTDKKTFVFVISKGAGASPRVEVHQVEIKWDDLKAKVKGFRDKVAPADPEQRSNDFKADAHELYDLLIRPASAELRGKSTLVIIPDGELWELPFQALQTPAGRYLLEDYVLSYAPSLLTLEKMTAARTGRARALANDAQGDGPKRVLLALGDPSQPAHAEDEGTPCHDTPPLPGAAEEVRKLSEEIYAGSGEGYVGADATERRFRSEAGNYRVIHLATHGLLDDEDPLFSQVMLSGQVSPATAVAPDAAQAADDGLIEAWELARLPLRADLVVLSACETARGRVGGGEGVMGLTWALAVAGTPATVASQWVVNSRGTTDLMLNFHRRLAPRVLDGGVGVGPAAALRQAALALMNDPGRPAFKHPYFWAGFIVVGDGR